MQTVTWDMVIELINGIFYNIDFEQDFMSICFDKQPITAITITSIIEIVNKIENGLLADDYMFENFDIEPVYISNDTEQYDYDPDEFMMHKRKRPSKKTKEALKKLNYLMQKYDI